MNITSAAAMLATQMETLANAGSALDRSLAQDCTFPSLLDVTKVSPQCLQTASGLNDMDYLRLDGILPGLDISQVNIYINETSIIELVLKNHEF
jgi:hypothetical protein